MKKTQCVVILFALVCLSCGLETFYQINPPTDAIPQNAADGVTLSPPVESSSSRKFEFTAAQNNSFIAPGTEVYYRIYDSLEKLQSDAKSINAVNADDKVDGFYRLQALNYRRLRTRISGKNQDLLIEGHGRVIIRLVEDGFGSGAFYSSTSVPVFRENNSPFYFGTPNETQKPPETGNADFIHSEPAGSFFYVNAYAVSTALQSSSWTRAVSKVLPLGFCAFRK